jgi:hypothetical protein
MQLHDRALKHLLANIVAVAVFRAPVSSLPAKGAVTIELRTAMKAQLYRLLKSTFMSDQALGFKLCMEVEDGLAARSVT